MDRMREQSINCGATIHTETVTSVDLSSRPFTVVSTDRTLKTWSLIIATGATGKGEFTIQECSIGL